MPTDFSFRLSTYLTLALACGALAYAEYDLLPEAAAFGGLMVGCIAVAFWADRTDRELSLTAANWVGTVLGLLAVGWIGYHFRTNHPLMDLLPSGMLPFLGPVLMMTMVAKLFRPKHVGDWWGLQVVGLCTVGLAATITDDEAFVIPLVVYVWAVAWSLTLFFVRRASGYVDPVPPHTHFLARAVQAVLGFVSPALAVAHPPHRPTVAAPFAGVGEPTRRERVSRSHLFRAVGWVGLVAVVALPLFLATPRLSGLQWDIRPRMEVGLPTDNTVDLSRSGELKSNQEPAFEVTAKYPDGRPKTDLAGSVRWRVAAYSEYDHGRGRWTKLNPLETLRSQPTMATDRLGWLTTVLRQPVFPDLGPGQYRLTFRPARKLVGAMPLLDPVAVRPGQPPTVMYFDSDRGGYKYATQSKDGAYMFVKSPVGHVQATAAGPLDDLTGPFIEPGGPTGGRFTHLEKNESVRIRDYTKAVINRLLDTGRLPAGVRDRRLRASLLPAEEDHALVARALRDHLSLSSDFAYTLTLRLEDKTLDPVEDFLFNTREGHCERFASALVLMLRSVGIRCQFVVGFKGCEPTEEEGKYLIRQEHAHAWVEALVWKPAARLPGPAAGDRDWYWLSLDPTPDTSDADAGGATDSAPSSGRKLIAELLLELNPDTQRRLTEAVGHLFDEYGRAAAVGAVCVGLAVVGWLAARRAARARAVAPPPADDTVPWYGRLVGLLTAAGHPPPAGRTPNEYAAVVSAALATDPRTATVAGVPAAVAGLVYAARYAGREPTEAELAAVNAALDRLEAVLPKAPANGTS